jgi:hypothetical protein
MADGVRKLGRLAISPLPTLDRQKLSLGHRKRRKGNTLIRHGETNLQEALPCLSSCIQYSLEFLRLHWQHSTEPDVRFCQFPIGTQ